MPTLNSLLLLLPHHHFLYCYSAVDDWIVSFTCRILLLVSLLLLEGNDISSTISGVGPLYVIHFGYHIHTPIFSVISGYLHFACLFLLHELEWEWSFSTLLSPAACSFCSDATYLPGRDSACFLACPFPNTLCCLFYWALEFSTSGGGCCYCLPFSPFLLLPPPTY